MLSRQPGHFSRELGDFLGNRAPAKCLEPFRRTDHHLGHATDSVSHLVAFPSWQESRTVALARPDLMTWIAISAPWIAAQKPRPTPHPTPPTSNTGPNPSTCQIRRARLRDRRGGIVRLAMGDRDNRHPQIASLAPWHRHDDCAGTILAAFSRSRLLVAICYPRSMLLRLAIR